MGEHIWHLITRVHVTKSTYLLFFRSEKILQRVVATIMTIYNNTIMSFLPFLMTFSYQFVSPTTNFPPIPDSLRLQGWLVESHVLMLKGQSPLEFHRPSGMYPRGKIFSCWHGGFIPPVLHRTTFMLSGSEVTGLTLLTYRN